MAPLAKALEVKLASTGDDRNSIYTCELDSSWRVVAVPQGGYALGTVVEACIEHQSESSHPDPIHVSAHFLRATNTGGAEIHVKVVKIGKLFTNLLANLVQHGHTKIAAHLIFGDLSPPPPGEGRKVLSPTSPYARRLPLTIHPCLTTPTPIVRKAWTFAPLMVQVSLDDEILARNQIASPTRTTNDTIGGGGVEWAAWCELASQGDKIKTSSLPFFGDTFVNMPVLLPMNEPASIGALESWYPTITMTVEFKARIPSSEEYSNTTVGLYCETRFLNEPHARHEARVEVWTAPSRIGQGEPVEGWRESQYCIAVADQMCITVPVDVNHRVSRKDSPKL